MAALSIYKASAGSGKTYKLTQAYLELLFRDPSSYRHILAVTFTNKAAREMKVRILDRLAKMATATAMDESHDLQHLAALTGMNFLQLKALSRELLLRILNDYSRFNVGTIDRFFQGVIRAFTREIGLPAGFNLELDRDRVLGEAIDKLFLRLGDDPELLSWLTRLAEVRIEASRNWNFRSEIQTLGQELFSEAYQEIMFESDANPDRASLDAYIAEVRSVGEKARSRARELASHVEEEMLRQQYSVADFYGKSRGPAAFFNKLLNKDKFELSDALMESRFNLSKWVSKKDHDPAKAHFAELVLMKSLQEIYEQIVLINTAGEIEKYVYALGILSDLAEEIGDISEERNLFMLSDASRFLKGLIGDNPTPFIYEKTGNNIDHIMLDEFQDTSVFQWENFRPLIDHTLSLGQQSMVVGDVKQSIYRWRNSDWKILAEEVMKAFPAFDIEEHSLKDNWRSFKNIIRFNNALFTSAEAFVRASINEKLEHSNVSMDFIHKWDKLLDVAYENLRQDIPASLQDTEGFIRGEIMFEEEDESFKEAALARLPQWITQLQDAGYQAGDIAILVRTNKEGSEIAEFLMELALDPDFAEYNLNFVSNESLFLQNNIAVKFLLSLLHYLNNPGDAINGLNLCYFNQLLNGNEENKVGEVFSSYVDSSSLFDADMEAKLQALKRLPLFELVEHLIALFKLQSREADLPYIQAFQELVLDLQSDIPGSLHQFLNYWEEFGHKKSIVVSEGQDAIQIITIHKSKGLQFKSVLLPFCNWDITPKASGIMEKVIWCKTEETPFDAIPVVPVRFGKTLMDSLFASEYLQEVIMGHVDSLNLLYVALTRAEEALYIAVPPRQEQVKNVGELLMRSMEHRVNDDSMMQLSEYVSDEGFIIGNLTQKEHKKESTADPWIMKEYPLDFRSDKLRLSLKSNEYFLESEHDEHSYLEYGNIMHEVFGFIEKPADAEQAVAYFNREGLLPDRDAATVLQLIQEKLDDARVKPWFAGEYEVHNERELYEDGHIFRPDRVMTKDKKAIVVDYKFGALKQDKYRSQVRRYCRILAESGYEQVEGYLWYVSQDEIEKVDE